MYKNEIFICSILFLIISCTSIDPQFHLNEIGKTITNFDASGWKNISISETDGDIAFQFFKKENDKFERIFFYYLKNSKEYLLNSYEIENLTEEYKYYIEIRADTLVHYRLNLDNNDREYFRGQYYAQFSELMLTEGQRNYFIDHYDSLTKIKGDNLPPLPSISKIE